MNDFEKKYQPFNFSENRTHIITLSVPTPTNPYIPGFVKIEKKLPSYIRHLTGIFISSSRPALSHKLAGYATLNFNGLSLPCVQIPVMKTRFLSYSPNPYPFDEKIIPNSFLQGYYVDVLGPNSDYPYNVNIYLHYKTED